MPKITVTFMVILPYFPISSMPKLTIAKYRNFMTFDYKIRFTKYRCPTFGRRAPVLFFPLRGTLESRFFRLEYPLSAMRISRAASPVKRGFFRPYPSTPYPCFAYRSCSLALLWEGYRILSTFFLIMPYSCICFLTCR